MRVPIRQRQNSLGFNMTPMIDVVFLLIIFFLVSSHLAKQEAQKEMDLATAESGDFPLTTDPRNLILNVMESGELILSGRAIEPAQLRARLSAAVAAAHEPLEVRIRSHRKVPYRQIEPLMRACAEEKVGVNFAVLERRRTN